MSLIECAPAWFMNSIFMDNIQKHLCLAKIKRKSEPPQPSEKTQPAKSTLPEIAPRERVNDVTFFAKGRPRSARLLRDSA